MSEADEILHYQQHQNDPEDAGYCAFLNRLWEPLKVKLAVGARGLDYGSGPGPTLHLMAQADGYDCRHYDPFFHPDDDALLRRYDFITCSETAEHFHAPGEEFARLAGMLRPGGWLGMMTTRHSEATDFANWHYRQDHSHVAFYSVRSFEVVAERFGLSPPEFISPTVVLLQKQLADVKKTPR